MNPPTETSRTERNRAIEGLRGFSAALVVCYHICNMGIAARFVPGPSSATAARLLAALGPFGVDLFFLISGYLIVQSLLRHGDVRSFLAGRVWRIYPVFLPLHLLIFLAGPVIGYAWMADLRHDPARYFLAFCANALFLPGLFSLPLAQKNAWSLSYEWGFYLIASLAFLGLAARRSRKALLGWGLLIVTAALAVAAIVLHPVAGFLAVGVGVFLLEDAVARRYRYRAWHAALGLACLLVGFALSAPPVWHLALALPFAGLSFLTVVRQEGLFARMLQTAPFLFLGRISYSLYLIHPFVLDPLRAFTRVLAFKGVPSLIAFAVFAVAGILGSLLAGWLSWRLIETALTKSLRSRAAAAHISQFDRRQQEKANASI